MTEQNQNPNEPADTLGDRIRIQEEEANPQPPVSEPAAASVTPIGDDPAQV